MKSTDYDTPVAGETFVAGKSGHDSYFITVCCTDCDPRRVEGFTSLEEARAWIRERVKKSASLYAEQDSGR